MEEGRGKRIDLALVPRHQSCRLIANSFRESQRMANETSPFQITPVTGGFELGFEVRAVKGEGQVKMALFDHFEMLCDEGTSLGGANSAPPPLAYFAASIVF